MAQNLDPIFVQDEREENRRQRVDNSGRFRRWILAAMVVLIVGVACIALNQCSKSRVVHQVAKFNPDDDKKDTDLDSLEDARKRQATPTPFATPAALVIPPPTTGQQVTPEPPKPKGPPTADQMRRLQELAKARSAPQMLEAFHRKHDTQEIASTNDALPPKAAIQINSGAPPFTVMAASIIPAILITGINSDEPAPCIAEVSENIFDTATGSKLLIPQGTRLIGMAGGADRSGQSRIRITWQRAIFPNTESIDLPSMPGTDEAGAGGFADQVDNHYLRTFGMAALTSLISVGQYIGTNNLLGNQGGNQFTGAYNNDPNSLAMTNASAQISQNMGSQANNMVRRGQNQPPTIEIRPGYKFDVLLTQDITFPGPYADRSN